MIRRATRRKGRNASVGREWRSPPAIASFRLLRVRARAGAAAAALLAVTAPEALRAQYVDAGAETRPGVVPREAAYLPGGPADRTTELRRWEGEDGARALRVWLDAPPAGRDEARPVARAGLRTWIEGGDLPFSLVPAPSADSADIRIRWAESLDGERAGSTLLEVDGEGHIRSATITLALRHAGGLPLGPEFLGFVALHEAGHALGLPHSEDPGDAMHPGSRNGSLSSRDLRSVRRLYGLEPGDPP